MLHKLILSSCIIFTGLYCMNFVSAQTLQEVVQLTLTTNPDLLVQTNEHLARKQELRQARSGYYPNIDLTAGIGHERSDNRSTRAQGDDWRSLTRKEASLTLQQNLFEGFATQSEVERQSARIKSQGHTVEGTGENTALQAVEVYLQILRHQQLLEYSEANLTAHNRVFKQVELRSRAGVGRSSDLDQVKGRMASANSNLLADRVNLHDAETNFMRVTGLVPENLKAVETRIDALPASLQAAEQLAFESHPTLRSATADVEATQAQHRASKHAFYPRIDLELGSTLGRDLDGVEGRDDDLTAMLRMRYNLFSGWKDEARMKQTVHLIDEAKEVRNRTHRQVAESIRLSWAAYEITLEQMDYLDRHVSASEKTRDAYSKQFKLGKRSLLDLLDTENEQFQAKRSYTDARFDNLFAQYRILFGVGGLVDYMGGV